jgi:RNA polymerase sigma-70 factor (ECF subfamily)
MSANIANALSRTGVCSEDLVPTMSSRDARFLINGLPAIAADEAREPADGVAVSLLDLLKLKLKTDEELAAKLQQGNSDAVTVLFERYSPIVFRHARRILRNDAEAEDVVQQVFLDLLRSADQFDVRKASFKTWLLMFSYCRTVNRWRQLQSRHYYDTTTIENVLPELFEGAQRPFPFHTAEAICLVEQALSLIQPRQRAAIELIYYEGLTPEEVAQKSGESIAAVRHNLYRGLDKIRTVLNEAAGSQKRLRGKKPGKGES